MNVRTAPAEGAARLAAAGIESARLDARLLWEHAFELSLPPSGGEGWGEGAPEVRSQNSEIRSVFEAFLARREAREPLAYIVGHKEFWSLDFAVGPGALVPRPETETLVEQALKAFPDRKAPLQILDLGTGTGCLLVTALTLYRNAAGTGIDISQTALDWARRNATAHSVSDRAELKQGTWDAAAGACFDLVLCNPPYLSTSEMARLAPELDYEPPLALESGPSGIEAYRALGLAISAALSPHGRAFIEIGAGQREAAAEALEAGGLEIEAVTPDLSGIPRCIAARRGRSPLGRDHKKQLETAGQAARFRPNGEAGTPAG